MIRSCDIDVWKGFDIGVSQNQCPASILNCQLLTMQNPAAEEQREQQTQLQIESFHITLEESLLPLP